MAVAHRRESMIALKAAHTAVRVARDLLYDPVDLEQLNCPDCGAQIDWKNANIPWYQWDLSCQACGAMVTLPCHLRAKILPPATLEVPSPAAQRVSRAHLLLALAFSLGSVIVLIVTWILVHQKHV